MMTKVLRVTTGLLFIAAITFSLERIPVNPTTAGFAYLVTILLVAARWGLVESVTASAAAAFCLNYFFLPPVRTLNIADAHNWVALSAFLMTSLVASQLSEVARRRNSQLHQRQTEMERLYALSRGIMLIDSEKPAGVQIATEIVRIYDVTSVTIYDQTDDQAWSAGIASGSAKLDTLRELAVRGDTVEDASANTFMAPITLAGRSIGAVAIEGRTGGSIGGGLLSDSALHAITNLIAVGLEKARTLELVSRAEAARQSEQFKSTLLDAVAHEFKTPLTSIKAATSTILTSKTLTPDQQHELLTIIDQESERLSALVTEAIHLARVESGRLHLSRTMRDVGELVQEALKQSSAMVSGRPVETEYAPSLPKVNVDAELFVVMVKQLLDNATKYSPAGTPIRISASASPDSVRICIHNQGQGLTEGERIMVFERFYRTPGARQNASGTGMGLAIVQDIVRAHGGYIDVDSEPGVGTEFSIRLPLAKGERN
jgi:two-component system, OmpR family, sensor histidine kinase KdpD